MAASELRGHLATLDSDLARRANVLWELAEPIQARASKPDASDNGTSHCLYVERYIWRLIHETQQLAGFSAIELFLLSCSACCHDLDRGLKTCITDGAQHGEGSGEFVVNYRGQLVISRPEAIAVDFIVRIHDKKGADFSDFLADLPEAYSLSSGPVDLQRLAVLLKAGDTLHTDNTRITELGTDPAKLEGMDRTKYLFRCCISGWRLDGNRIAISACPESEEQLEALLKGESFMTDKEWPSVADALRRYRFPYELEFENDDHLLCGKAAEEAPRDLPGMDYYHEGDASLLAGRDAEIEALERQVLGNRSSLLIGPSGVGKSSILHAGLVPRMRQLSGWGIVMTRPDKVTGAFFTAGDFRHVVDGSVTRNDDFAELCRRAIAKQSRLLLVLDQFEDIAYFGTFDIDAVASPVLDALARHRRLTLLFSYRDDVESVMLPLWQAISHTAAGLPKYAVQRLGRDSAEASVKKLLSAKKTVLEDSDSFMSMLLEELAGATEREAGMAGSVIYPPFIQMVVLRLVQLAEQGRTRRDSYEALAAAGNSATDQVITQFLKQGIKNLPRHGFIEEHVRRVLVALARSSGKKGSADEPHIVAETQVPADRLSELLAQMAKMRLVRRLESGQWEIMHDLMAKTVIAELISEEERCFKQAWEALESRALGFQQHHATLNPREMRDLWVMRERIRPDQLTDQQRLVILTSMGISDGGPLTSAGLELTGRRLGDPAMWSAPGWCWLGNLKERNLLNLLREAAATGEVAGVLACLKGAALIGSPKDIHTLVQVMRDRLDWPQELVRKGFATMVRLATRRELPPLREMIEDETVGRQAALAFRKLVTRREIPLLRRMAEDEKPSVRRAAIEALGKIATREDLPLVQKMVKDKDDDVREAATLALDAVATARELPLLREILRDRHPRVREAAEEVFLRVATRKELPFLREMIKDRNAEVRNTAMQALGRLGTPDDWSLLVQVSRGLGSAEKWAAQVVLGKLAIRKESLPLRTALGDTRPYVRMAAVLALGELASRKDLPLLRKAIKAQDPNVQKAAVGALGSLGTHQDVSLLWEIIKDRSSNIRQEAVEALSRLATREDVSLLIGMIMDEDPVVRRVAARALKRLGVCEDLLVLCELLRRSRHQVVLELTSSAIAGFVDGDRLVSALEKAITDLRPELAVLAARAAAEHATSNGLRQFLEKHQHEMTAAALAVFDWQLYAPVYMKRAYARWQAVDDVVADSGG